MGCVDQDPGVLQNRIDFNVRATKLGRALASFTAETFFDVESFSAAEGTVNEQNVQAVGFYEEDGVRAVPQNADGRAGWPYPLLYMKRGRAGEAL